VTIKNVQIARTLRGARQRAWRRMRTEWKKADLLYGCRQFCWDSLCGTAEELIAISKSAKKKRAASFRTQHHRLGSGGYPAFKRKFVSHYNCVGPIVVSSASCLHDLFRCLVKYVPHLSTRVV